LKSFLAAYDKFLERRSVDLREDTRANFKEILLITNGSREALASIVTARDPSHLIDSAIYLMRSLKLRSFAPLLFDAMVDPTYNDSQRHQAALALGFIGDYATGIRLRSMLRSKGDPKTEVFALYASSLMPGHRMDETIIRTFIDTSRDESVRAAAARAINDAVLREALPYVRNCLIDAKGDLRLACVQATGDIGTGDDLDLLARIMAETESSDSEDLREALELSIEAVLRRASRRARE